MLAQPIKNDYELNLSPLADPRRAAGETAARILIVDHDPAITPILGKTLAEAGYRIESTASADCKRSTMEVFAPNCTILNFNPRDGKRPYNLIDETRGWFDAPIVAVSEVCTENVRVAAFERGADDYVCVPFGLREFTARIEALLRRATQPLSARYLRLGGLQLDRAARSALLNGEALELTSKEFDILVCLARNPCVVVSTEALLAQVWGADFVHSNQTLRVHISNIRKKARSALPNFIRSVPSHGYVMVIPQSVLTQLPQVTAVGTFVPESAQKEDPNPIKMK